MALEVALLEWGEESGGVRMLGRSTDPALVEVVREHLTRRLSPYTPGDSRVPIRLVSNPNGEDDGGLVGT